jgi:hypothetical protein
MALPLFGVHSIANGIAIVWSKESNFFHKVKNLCFLDKGE